MVINCKELYDNPSKYEDILSTKGYLIYLFTNTVNNKHYVGDTTVDLKFRLYFNGHWKGHFICYENGCNVHLYNSMRKYGLDKFTIEIIYQGKYVYDLEERFIEKYDSFYHGYNGSISGKSLDHGYINTGRIIVSTETEEHFIKPDELEYYLSLGYKKGRRKSTYRLSDPDIMEKQRASRTANDNWNKDISWCNTEEAIKKRSAMYLYITPNNNYVVTSRANAGKYRNKGWKLIRKATDEDIINYKPDPIHHIRGEKYLFIDENGDKHIMSYPGRVNKYHPTWINLGLYVPDQNDD